MASAFDWRIVVSIALSTLSAISQDEMVQVDHSGGVAISGIGACVAWRRTAHCNPFGSIKSEETSACDVDVPAEESGYCECELPDGAVVNTGHAGCGHDSFRCEDICHQVPQNLCYDFVQTHTCADPDPHCNVTFDVDGSAAHCWDWQPSRTKLCNDIIDSSSAGFCECGAPFSGPGSGLSRAVLPCTHPPVTCAEVCRSDSYSKTTRGIWESSSSPETSPSQAFVSKSVSKNVSETASAKELCFAEHMLPAWTRETNYLIKIYERGVARAPSMKIVVLGLIRNSAGQTARIVQTIFHTLRRFGDARLILVENDSEDGTQATLTNICRDPKVHCLSQVYGASKWKAGMHAERITAMAHARRFMLSAFRAVEGGRLLTWDLVAVVDLDLVPRNGVGWDEEMLYLSLGRNFRRPWDVICSQGLNVWDRDSSRHLYFHDVIAFRPRGFRAQSTQQLHRMFESTARTLFNDGIELKPVDSCFGGMALYNPSVLRYCDYDVGDRGSNFDQLCEHVGLNKCMRETGHDRIFLDPLMSTYYSDAMRTATRIKEIDRVCVDRTNPTTVLRHEPT